ncbi:hypothetical protein [Clostridium sp.]|uniref:hypothetical protein n=1 Tax=Clostridium sp. TaxID=1506 RepID=UPI0026369329|nr:hypothetical protein [Clostridium sp.]
MGQYIQAGICYRIKISKEEMKRSKVSYEEIIEGLAKEIQINIYEVNEIESGYIFSLKDEILENGNLQEFLIEQYKALDVDEDKMIDIVSRLKELSKVNDIIDFAKEKRYQNFQCSSVYDYIYCTIWRDRVMVEYETILFMIEGKIIMECYRSFIRYIENLIKKSNIHRISEAVKVFIQ